MNKMIHFANTQVTGWEAAIRGMRNPMNSWDKSDSLWKDFPEGNDINADGDSEGFYCIVRNALP